MLERIAAILSSVKLSCGQTTLNPPTARPVAQFQPWLWRFSRHRRGLAACSWPHCRVAAVAGLRKSRVAAGQFTAPVRPQNGPAARRYFFASALVFRPSQSPKLAMGRGSRLPRMMAAVNGKKNMQMHPVRLWLRCKTARRTVVLLLGGKRCRCKTSVME